MSKVTMLCFTGELPRREPQRATTKSSSLELFAELCELLLQRGELAPHCGELGFELSNAGVGGSRNRRGGRGGGYFGRDRCVGWAGQQMRVARFLGAGLT